MYKVGKHFLLGEGRMSLPPFHVFSRTASVAFAHLLFYYFPFNYNQGVHINLFPPLDSGNLSRARGRGVSVQIPLIWLEPRLAVLVSIDRNCNNSEGPANVKLSQARGAHKTDECARSGFR